MSATTVCNGCGVVLRAPTPSELRRLSIGLGFVLRDERDFCPACDALSPDDLKRFQATRLFCKEITPHDPTASNPTVSRVAHEP